MATPSKTASAMIPLVLATFSAKCQVPRLLISCRPQPRPERILVIEAVQIQENPHGRFLTLHSLELMGYDVNLWAY